MKRVLMVSKPIAPPWSDSSKNLVRDIAGAIDDVPFTLLGHPGFSPDWPGVRWNPVYGGAGRYAPSLSQNMRVFVHLLRPGAQTGLLHFFFAPNPRTSRILSILMRLNRLPSIHTICSLPRDFDSIASLLFADHVVVLSHFAEKKFREAGVPRVTRIPPGIDLDLWKPSGPGKAVDAPDPSASPVLLYAGDYESPGTVDVLLRAFASLQRSEPRARLVFACRLKTPEARREEQAARSAAAQGGFADKVRFLNEVTDMRELLESCSLAVFPVESLYRKMDIPLVLLEGMALGKPVVVYDVEPLREILAGGGGMLVPPGEPEALSSTLRLLLSEPERYRTLQEEAVRSVSENWSARRMAAEYRRLYLEVLGRPDE